MDVAAGYLTQKLGIEFTLKTANGPVIFTQPAGLPAIREGDMILVVVDDHGLILAISDLTTGSEMQYKPWPPFKDERLWAPWLILISLFVVALPTLGYSVARAGMPEASAYVLSVGAFFYVVLFLSHWWRMKNHNVRLSNRVQAFIRNACMDAEIWEIPEPETHDGERWKD
jgi:hypothetical protein